MNQETDKEDKHLQKRQVIGNFSVLLSICPKSCHSTEMRQE